MSYCNKDDLIEPISKDIEGLLVKQLGEKFALVEVTTLSGEKKFFRANSISSIKVRGVDIPFEKKIGLKKVTCQTRIQFQGNPTCIGDDLGGDWLITCLECEGEELNATDCFK